MNLCFVNFFGCGAPLTGDSLLCRGAANRWVSKNLVKALLRERLFFQHESDRKERKPGSFGRRWR